MSLGKIVNALDKEAENTTPAVGAKGRKSSATPSVAGGEESVVEGEDGEGVDDKTVVEKTILEARKGDERVGEKEKESEDEEEDTILALQAQVKREVQSQERDELVEELLSDVEMSGM